MSSFLEKLIRINMCSTFYAQLRIYVMLYKERRATKQWMQHMLHSARLAVYSTLLSALLAFPVINTSYMFHIVKCVLITLINMLHTHTQVGQLSLAILPWLGAMSTRESWDVNRHTAWCTSPVSVVSQCKLVSGWGLGKRRSAPPHGPYGWGMILLCFTFT